MKTALLLSASLLAAPFSQAAVIGFWDFNDGFDVEDEVAQIVHTASIGSGTLYQQRADTDGNGKGGLTFIDAANGIDNSGAADDKAIAWDDLAKSGDNDAEIFIVIDTTNFLDIVLSFDAKADDDPADRPDSFDLKTDIVGLVDVMPPDVNGTVKDFDGGTSTEIFNNEPLALTDTLTRFTFDLSSFDGLENQSTLVLRLDDFSGPDENNELRLDNFLITGTVVPEPSSLVLGLLGGLGLLARRRR